MNNKKVIVFGATGDSGLAICNELSHRNIEHFAFVRPQSIDKIRNQQTKIIEGDILEMNSVEKAFGSQHFTNVIVAIGSQKLKSNNIRLQGTKNIIDAIYKKSERPHLHIISSHGVGDSRKQLGFAERLAYLIVMRSILKDHEKQEEVAKSYQGKYHIIRPVALMKSSSSTEYFVSESGKLPNKKLSYNNLASYIVVSLMQDKTGIYSVSNTK